MELISAFTDRSVVVVLAVSGAVMATVGTMLGAQRAKKSTGLGRAMTWLGYAISFASVVLFIVAGFLSNR